VAREVEGLTREPGSPEPQETEESLSSCVTPRAESWSPRASMAWGVSSSVRALAGITGQARTKGQAQDPIDWEPEAPASP
jgi:hypothetical protein